jgi:hypothetical protein
MVPSLKSAAAWGSSFEHGEAFFDTTRGQKARVALACGRAARLTLNAPYQRV